MYFRDADVAIIVFDLTDKGTMEKVEYWASEVLNANPGEFMFILVGNKNDLTHRR